MERGKNVVSPLQPQQKEMRSTMRASTQLSRKLKYGKLAPFILITDKLTPCLLSDFAPVIIDGSQPIDDDLEVSHQEARKKMFREKSPKETYFEHLTSTGGKRSELGMISQKHDMIKQL